jgi:hypothetical protein
VVAASIRHRSPRLGRRACACDSAQRLEGRQVSSETGRGRSPRRPSRLSRALEAHAEAARGTVRLGHAGIEGVAIPRRVVVAHLQDYLLRELDSSGGFRAHCPLARKQWRRTFCGLLSSRVTVVGPELWRAQVVLYRAESFHAWNDSLSPSARALRRHGRVSLGLGGCSGALTAGPAAQSASFCVDLFLGRVPSQADSRTLGEVAGGDDTGSLESCRRRL